MANNELIPDIRFVGFSEPWGQRRLSDVSDVRDGTHDSPPYQSEGHPFVTSKNVKDGYINYDDIQFISDEYFEAINRRSKVDVNDILMGMIGTIGNLALIRTEPDFAIKNVALIKDTKQVSYLYLYSYLQSPNTERQLISGLDGGTQKFVSLKKIRELNILVPSEEEQIKVGTFIESLDNLITLHQRKLEKLQAIKRSMLEKMFPRDGSSFPEIRFAGFTDPWEQRKFSELTSVAPFKSYLKGANEDGEYEVIQQGDSPVLGYADGNPFIDFEKVTLFGDHTLSLYKPKAPFFVATDGLKILYSIGTDGLFYYYLLERYKPESEGYKRHFSILKECDCSYTSSAEEQSKIGEFFDGLDNNINLYQRKLEKLMAIKRSMLEKMFV